KANEQLDVLMRIDPEKEYSMVEFGTVIITNKQNLFISIGLGKVLTEEAVFYAISPAVPIYKAMAGKKAGEEFAFNNITYKIEKIY
ncbi:MAG: GreA/GreB family elongation factor, partial [Bacteroidales bacterium]|nr:GreA/GreB family elongation factor [Bacteroidales bacterium]